MFFRNQSNINGDVFSIIQHHTIKAYWERGYCFLVGGGYGRKGACSRCSSLLPWKESFVGHCGQLLSPSVDLGGRRIIKKKRNSDRQSCGRFLHWLSCSGSSDNSETELTNIYIYIYIYMCVCVCVCVPYVLDCS
jgi:hypothetical protein